MKTFKAQGLSSRIHRKGKWAKLLSDQSKQGNRTNSPVRVRVETVFGAQTDNVGGTSVKTIGLVRATTKIGTKEPRLQNPSIW